MTASEGWGTVEGPDGRVYEVQAHAPTIHRGRLAAFVPATLRPLTDTPAPTEPCETCGGEGFVVALVTDHSPTCWGDCAKHGCPVPVQDRRPCPFCQGGKR